MFTHGHDDNSSLFLDHIQNALELRLALTA